MQLEVFPNPLVRARRAQERTHAGEAVGADEAQPLDVEGLALGRVGHEIHHVGQGARQRLHVEGNPRLVQRPLRRVAGGVAQVVRGAVRPAHSDLEGNGKTHVVDTVQHAVVAADLAIAGQFVFDGIEVGGAGNAVHRFANRWARADGRRQARVIRPANDHGGAVQCFKAPAVAVDVDRRQAVVAQASATGLDVIDAKNQGIKTNDVHGYHSVEIIIRRRRPNARIGRWAVHGIRGWCRPQVRLRRRLTWRMAAD